MSGATPTRVGPGVELLSRVPFPESQRELDALRQRIEFDLFRAPATGVLLGRYRIDRALGRGGLGVVYLAHDPELDRPVALKVARVGETTSLTELHAWVRREAQALARVAHPNVVQVYSVELVDETLVLVMEYVDGRTLRACMRDDELTRGQLLAVFSDAAGGLHAAHEVGVIHRDFKPENVMIDREGRARVLDFGLARVENPRSVELVSGVMGTVPYMAPEQLQGGSPSPATDQFALCVALFEALAERRPFPGRKVGARLDAIEAGPPLRPPEIERDLYRVIARGLAADPSDRFASMDDLRRALVRATSPQRTGAFVLAATAVVVSAAMIGASARTQPAGACAASTRDLELAWNEDAARAGHAHFARVWSPDPDASWARVQGQLDAYADDWRSTRAQACDASPPAAHAVDCLTAVLPLLAKLAASLRSDERPGIEATMVTIAELPPARTCFLAGPTSSPEHVGRSPAEEELIAELAELHGTWLAGSEMEAIDHLRRELEGSESGDPRARALLLQRLANYSFQRVDPRQTIAWAKEAYELGTAEQRPVVAMRVAALLGAAYAQGGELERATRWNRFAVAAMIRGPTPIDARLDVMRSTAILLGHQGREVDAAAISLAMYTVATADPDVTPLHRARTYSSTAKVLADLDDLEGAEALARQAFALAQEQVGQGHPALAYHHLTLGEIARGRGELEECVEHMARASVAPAAGPTWVTAAAQGELGHCLWQAERYEEAIAANRAAVETRTALSEFTSGTGGVELALHNLGGALRARGHLDEAAQALRRAEALGREQRGTASAATLIELSRLELERDLEASRSWAEQAEAAYRSDVAAGPTRSWHAALALADLALRHGDTARWKRLVAEVEAMPRSEALQAELEAYRDEWAE